SLLLGAVRSIMDSPPSPRELERAKTYTIGTHALAHQRTRDRAFYLGWYELVGAGYAFDQEFARRIAGVTLSDFNAAARKYLANSVVDVGRPDKCAHTSSAP